MSHCSPSKAVKSNNTCMTYKELKMIADDYNQTISDTQKKIKICRSKEKLHENIRQALQSHCNEESCWIEQDFLSGHKKRILEESFRPKTPRAWYKNKRTWLNTYDILNVMRQYENLYKDFYFLGVFPIDFTSFYPSSGTCIGDAACTIEITQLLEKKKKRFGIVLNLDNHTQSGSHWVSVYCGFDPKKPNFGIYYYDSVAYPPSKEIKDFFTKIKEQVSRHYGDNAAAAFEVRYNTVQKQFKNTECGVFSIVFQTQMLKDIEFDTICKQMRKDDRINEIRDIIYRP